MNRFFIPHWWYFYHVWSKSLVFLISRETNDLQFFLLIILSAFYSVQNGHYIITLRSISKLNPSRHPRFKVGSRGVVIVWSANESPFRGRPLFGEPPLNLRVTGWFLTSHHFLLTQRKWFKLNAEIIIKYICHKKPVSFLLTLREKNLVISGQSVTVTGSASLRIPYILDRGALEDALGFWVLLTQNPYV